LLAAVVAGWWLFGPAPATPSARAGAPPPRRPTGTTEAALPSAEEMTVRLSTLEHDVEALPEAKRNLFRFEQRARESAATAKPDLPAPTPTLPSPTPPAETTPAVTPIQLKFIGIVEKADLKLAVLIQGEGRAPMFGKEGDIIDGRYRILKIGVESIDLAYADGRGRQTIRLTGQ
jgi:hypothetical protein